MVIGVPACLNREAPPPQAGRLRIGAAVPQITQGIGVEAIVDALIGDPLVSVAWNGRPEGRLAESWQESPDRLTLRLNLRPKVSFHDGQPLTAATVERFLNNARATGEFISENVTAVKAIDHSVVLSLRQPDSLVLTDLNFGSVIDPVRPEVGTGPFRVAGKSDSYRLKANEHYYRGRPRIGDLEVRPYATQRSAWAAMMRGEIDALHEVSREAVEFVEHESSVRTYSFLRPYYLALVFNVAHPVMKHAEIRRALSFAVDRRAIVERALGGRGEPAKGPFWPHHWAYSDTGHAYDYNAEAAKLGLDHAGLQAPADAPPGTMPARFAFRCLVADDPRFERIALIVQKQLYDVGVDMQIEVVSVGTLARRLMDGTFDAFLLEMTSGRSLAWVYRFWHSPGQATLIRSGYRAADAALDRMRLSVGDDEVRAAVADVQRVLHQDPPAIFLAWGDVSRAISTAYTVPAEGSPDVMGSLWQWQPPARAGR